MSSQMVLKLIGDNTTYTMRFNTIWDDIELKLNFQCDNYISSFNTIWDDIELKLNVHR